MSTYKKSKQSKVQQAVQYYKTYGIQEFVDKAIGRVTGKRVSYETWFQAHKATEEELERQSNEIWEEYPLISIIVPAYRTPQTFLKQMIDSLLAQTYANWELCIADGSGTKEKNEKLLPEQVIREKYPLERRIKCCALPENLGIAGNTNAALTLATGKYIALLDHDDVLAPNALYEVIKMFQKEDKTDVVYTDEDKVDMQLIKHYQPHFKSDFNWDYLCTNNYICHFFAVKKEIVDRVGKFQAEFDGAQDFDFILRCVKEARKVAHIPKILYYWRMHPGSVAENPESKQYAYEAGRQAVEAQLAREHKKASVTNTGRYGLYRVRYEVENSPFVSIIRKENREDGKKNSQKIKEVTTYQNYEIVSSVDQAKGEYLVFLEEELQILTADWLEELLGNAQRCEVGAVGAKIYQSNGRIESAGILLGVKGIAAHAFAGMPRKEIGYYAKAVLQQDVSAVSEKCMMISNPLYQEIIEEQRQEQGCSYENSALQQLDLCLRLRSRKLLIVYQPYVEVYDEGNYSPDGMVVNKKKCEAKEIERFLKRWKKVLEEGDPYYNTNLTKERCDYSIGEK